MHVLARGGGTGLGSGVRLPPYPLPSTISWYWPVVYIAFTVTVLETSLPLYWIRFAKFSITDKGRGGPVIADVVVYLRSSIEKFEK